jgi:hypothetical protein
MIVRLTVIAILVGLASGAAQATTPDRPNACFGKVCVELSVEVETGSRREISTRFSPDMTREEIRIVSHGDGRIELAVSDARDSTCEGKSILLTRVGRRVAKAKGCLRYPLDAAYGSRVVDITYHAKNSDALARLLEVVGPIWAVEASPGETWRGGYSLRLGPSYRVSE